ncbi:PLP-dependent aminotransferase family protein [Paenibacillus thermoaerophilus]|uniref:PLP-dependent aminotransferase family protein n=1 Tax=Paenibacillus thermoaerophilus TaxID=1215385 RepID=A0ABW2V2J1_9BACL|nr:PLP-dependent aminotransferase family protein [Paenibacillus thermoaerophilus]TMV17778.1 PLP-dependent aminotransferase family protein [Paenibacillus thermoaerophilus]
MTARATGPATKYARLAGHLRSELAAGAYRPGQALPSIRQLAAEWGCSRNTAIRALAELEREHLVYAKPKSGYYAMPQPAGGRESSESRIDLASAAPDERYMPYRDFQHCLNQAIDRYRHELFDYTDPQGLLPLRQALAESLRDRQLFVSPDRIFIVSGSQQALHLLAGLTAAGAMGPDGLLAEQPTYSGMLRAAAAWRLRAQGVRRTFAGIDEAELERHMRSGRFGAFYTTPRLSNPLGASYTKRQKLTLLRLARKYGVYVIEDDYLADLETDSKSDPLFGMDDADRTIYISSFSKSMLPGLRLAAVVVPPALAEAFRKAKYAADQSTPVLSQGALEIYLRSGMHAHHTARMRRMYAERMAVLREACAAELPDAAAIDVPDAGLFAGLRLPVGMDARLAAERLRRDGVDTLPVIEHFLPDFPSEPLLRLSVIRADEPQIRLALARIGAALRGRRPGRAQP